MKKRLAVLVSGTGSNLKAICAAIQSGQLKNCEVALVASDRPECEAVAWAKKEKYNVWVEAFLKSRTQAQDREIFFEKLLNELRKAEADWVILAGFMRILSDSFIEAFRVSCETSQGGKASYTRIVNVHPSLLPAFKGKDAYQQAFEYGVKLTGVTVHLVESELDSGPICSQESFSIQDCESADEVQRRGLAIEHRIFPETVNWLLSENFKVIEKGTTPRRFCVRKN